MRTCSLVFACSIVLVACKPHASVVEDASTTAVDAAPSASASAAAPPPPDGRGLAAGATFGDLVAAVQALAAADKNLSQAGCNLRHLADGTHRFEATIAPDRIGAAPQDLDDILQAKGVGILVATPWGMIGTGDGITLQTLSPLPKSVVHSLVPGLFVTDRGVYLRLTVQPGMRFGSSDKGPMPESDVDRVKTELAPRAEAIVVAAEAGVKLDRLREVLGWLDGAKGPVVFAVPLGKDAKPPPKKATDAKLPLGADGCPGGADLMDIPKGEKPGSYEMSAMSNMADPYTKDAMQCAGKLPPGGAGGRIKLDMRIEPDGTVSKACLMKDEIGDAALRACVLARTRAHVFPKPDTEGIVNYGTELAFTPPGLGNKALCD